MRQCIFIAGTRAQLGDIAPVLKLAAEKGLRHSVWYTGQQHETVDDLVEQNALHSRIVLPDSLPERSVVGRILVWFPASVYRLFHYATGVKAWTGRRPLVVVHGDTLSTWLGALAGSWGGGDIVRIESGSSSVESPDAFPGGLIRRLTYRKIRYALCKGDDATERMQKYPGCIVVNTADDSGTSPTQTAIEVLARWAS